MLPRGKQVQGPRFDLEQFQAELQSDNFHVYRTRALDPIRTALRCSARQARGFARQVVLALQPDDYAYTLSMPNGQVQDVYGALIKADGWYLKIEIHMDDGQPGIVSCHPAEYDIITIRGTVPRSTWRE
ncbi:MAG TPA: hypothetical protein VLK84_27715 [Longimicrobium sp.]|nr:hypothetical protein [Longimicrobium sp.]